MPESSPASAIVWLHPDAPAKPSEGAPCNGCGLCCLSEPCPLGVVVSRRRTGSCSALRWSAEARRYHCGVLADARQPLWRWLVRRWIASGVGCDAELASEPVRPPAAGTGNQQP